MVYLAAQLRLDLTDFGYPFGMPAALAKAGDFLQSLALVGRVGFHRLHQLRDEVVAAFELNVDVAPGGFDAVCVRNQAVINNDAPGDETD